MSATTLVIGFGNDLRGDDAAGRLVADGVRRLAPRGVRVRSIAQLVPELVLELAGSGGVVFVDADRDALQVSVREVLAGGDGDALTHHLTPAGLLRLARTVGIEPPPALLVTVPARDLGLGRKLSAATDAGVRAATELVAELVEGRSPILGRDRPAPNDPEPAEDPCLLQGTTSSSCSTRRAGLPAAPRG